MTVTIHKGDAIRILQGLPEGSIDCAIVDPPYGETSLRWDRWPKGWPLMVRRLLKPSGSMWVFGSLRMFFDSVQFVRSEHGRALHPTQKPLALVEPLLLYACPPGGHVLDPFAGSGTVGVLAQRHKMDCTLIEADSKFHEVIQQRLQDDAPLLQQRV